MVAENGITSSRSDLSQTVYCPGNCFGGHRSIHSRGDRRRDQFNIANLGGDTGGLLIDGAVANMTVLPNQSGQIIEHLHLISSYRHAPIAERTDREIWMG